MLMSGRCINSLRSILHINLRLSTSLFVNISIRRLLSLLHKLPAPQVQLWRKSSHSISHHTKNELTKGNFNKFVRTLHNEPQSSIYVWGRAATGALGIKPAENISYSGREPQSTPYKMTFVASYYAKEERPQPVIVAAGHGYTILVYDSQEGYKLLGCGLNTDLQLGYQESHIKPGDNQDIVLEPSEINLPLPSTTKIISVLCGRAHTLITTDEEEIFSFGNNAHGQCGRTVERDDSVSLDEAVKQVMFPKKVKQVCCGLDHTVVLADDGTVYSCGLGADGQTGLGHYDAVCELSHVKGDIHGEKISYISSKADCVLALSERGDVFGWGNSEYGQLASVAGSGTQVNVSRHLPFSSNTTFVKVAAAGTMCALIDDQGDVYTWGYGALGRSRTVEQSNTPVLIPRMLFGGDALHAGDKLNHIDCGLNHFAALNNTGELYLWGLNRNGCLDVTNQVHNPSDHFIPNKVAIMEDVTQVACGVDHNVVICRR